MPRKGPSFPGRSWQGNPCGGGTLRGKVKVPGIALGYKSMNTTPHVLCFLFPGYSLNARPKVGTKYGPEPTLMYLGSHFPIALLCCDNMMTNRESVQNNTLCLI